MARLRQRTISPIMKLDLESVQYPGDPATPGTPHDDIPQSPQLSPISTQDNSIWSLPEPESNTKAEEDTKTEVTTPSTSLSTSTRREKTAQLHPSSEPDNSEHQHTDRANPHQKPTFTKPPECTLDDNGHLQPHYFWSRYTRPCLQCHAKGLPCNQADAEDWTAQCKRCVRSHTGETCLAVRRTTLLEQEEELGADLAVDDSGMQRGKLLHWPGPRVDENTFFLVRLPTDGEGVWERKLVLADELLDAARTRLERSNWVYPSVDGLRSGSVCVRNGTGRTRWERRAFQTSAFEQIKEAGGSWGIDVGQWVASLDE